MSISSDLHLGNLLFDALFCTRQAHGFYNQVGERHDTYTQTIMAAQVAKLEVAVFTCGVDYLGSGFAHLVRFGFAGCQANSISLR